jgi:hypothetical protein
MASPKPPTGATRAFGPPDYLTNEGPPGLAGTNQEALNLINSVLSFGPNISKVGFAKSAVKSSGGQISFDDALTLAKLLPTSVRETLSKVRVVPELGKRLGSAVSRAYTRATLKNLDPSPSWVLAQLRADEMMANKGTASGVYQALPNVYLSSLPKGGERGTTGMIGLNPARMRRVNELSPQIKPLETLTHESGHAVLNSVPTYIDTIRDLLYEIGKRDVAAIDPQAAVGASSSELFTKAVKALRKTTKTEMDDAEEYAAEALGQLYSKLITGRSKWPFVRSEVKPIIKSLQRETK